jgi:AcrR family transcriptional regulator
VASTSLDDIMAATRTSKSQLYHYFADKDALVLEVIRRQLDQIIAGQETELRELRTWEGLQRWRDHLVEETRPAGSGRVFTRLAGQRARRPLGAGPQGARRLLH